MNKLYFIFLSIIIILSLYFTKYNVEGLDMPDYSGRDITKYDNKTIDIQYHDSIENILKNDFTGNISMHKTYFPNVLKLKDDVYGNTYNAVVKGNIIEIDNVATQGSFLYYNPIDYTYSLKNYVPDYETATYLSRTGTVAELPPINYKKRLDYQDFSKKYSPFTPGNSGNDDNVPNFEPRPLPSSFFKKTEIGKYATLAEKGKEPVAYGATLRPVTTAKPRITKGIYLVKDPKLNFALRDQFQ
jgi:hypothetical protein